MNVIDTVKIIATRTSVLLVARSAPVKRLPPSTPRSRGIIMRRLTDPDSLPTIARVRVLIAYSGLCLALAGMLGVGCGGDDASDESSTVAPSTTGQGPCMVESPAERVEVELGNSGLPCEEAESVYEGYTSWLTAAFEAGTPPESPATHAIGEWECYSLPAGESRELATCESGDRKFVVVANPRRSQRN
jgi:hypothetical protein